MRSVPRREQQSIFTLRVLPRAEIGHWSAPVTCSSRLSDGIRRSRVSPTNMGALTMGKLTNLLDNQCRTVILVNGFEELLKGLGTQEFLQVVAE